ncbi:MAG: nitrous oxide reductase accessory protein NosL [Pseudomonadota bacterium]|nr:nitrous oxide reductase accessory protein NosL [Pseudomonadota bacterium]
MGRIKLRVLLMLSLLGLVLPIVGMAEVHKHEVDYCGLCGKEVANAHVKFVVTYPGGKQETLGCAGCGLSVMSVQKVEGGQTMDFLRGEMLDAKVAFYVVGSDFGACCAPSWLSFSSQKEAEKFAKGFGGEVLDFDGAMAWLAK